MATKTIPTMLNDSIRQRRPTRRRRSSSATICPSSSPTTSTIQLRTTSPCSPKRASAIRFDWRKSKRSPSELAGLKFLVLSHIQELEKKLETLEPNYDISAAQHRPKSPSSTLRAVSPSESALSRSPSVEPSSSMPTSFSITPLRARSRKTSHSRSGSDSSSDSWQNELGLPTWDSEFDFSAVDDLRTWVQDTLVQLAHLRSEVSARLPDLDEIKAHFPDFEDWDFEFPSMEGLGVHADELIEEFRTRLLKVEVPNLSEMKAKLGDLGYEYLPTLSEHLSNLHAHVKVLKSHDFLPKDWEFQSRTLDRGHAVLRDFIDTLMYDDDSPTERKRVVDEVERTIMEVERALVESQQGAKLIGYHQL